MIPSFDPPCWLPAKTPATMAIPANNKAVIVRRLNNMAGSLIFLVSLSLASASEPSLRAAFMCGSKILMTG